MNDIDRDLKLGQVKRPDRSVRERDDLQTTCRARFRSQPNDIQHKYSVYIVNND